MRDYIRPFIFGILGLLFGQLCVIAYNDHILLMKVVQALSKPAESK